VVANSQAFVEHVLDLLNASIPSTARKLFGGHGIYCEGLMYGLIDDDAFFLKADDECRQTYLDAGCRQWFYGGPEGPMAGGYYEPPSAAIDDPDEMRPWAAMGLAAARRKRAAKERTKAAKGPQRAKKGAERKVTTTGHAKAAGRGKAATTKKAAAKTGRATRRTNGGPRKHPPRGR
jgi:DNA transformation protein